MKETRIATVAKGSMIAALFVVVVFLGGGITHWFGLFLIPLVIYLGDSTALGIAVGAFLSSFIVPRDPLVIVSALVGGASFFAATILYDRVYRVTGRLPRLIRLEVAGLLACILVTLTDGTRTVVSWRILFGNVITLEEVWIITFAFSFLCINVLGIVINYGLANLLTATEQSRAVGRF